MGIQGGDRLRPEGQAQCATQPGFREAAEGIRETSEKCREQRVSKDYFQNERIKEAFQRQQAEGGAAVDRPLRQDSRQEQDHRPLDHPGDAAPPEENQTSTFPGDGGEESGSHLANRYKVLPPKEHHPAQEQHYCF